MDNPEHLKSRMAKVNKTAGTLRQEKVNIDEMHHPEKYAIAKEDDIFEKVIPGKNVEDEGEIKIWYIKDSEKVDLPLEEYGVFYSHECYLVHYSIHLRSGGYRHVVYFWVGRKSAKVRPTDRHILSISIEAILTSLICRTFKEVQLFWPLVMLTNLVALLHKSVSSKTKNLSTFCLTLRATCSFDVYVLYSLA